MELLSIIGVVICILAANWLGRWTMYHQRAWEIKEAFQQSPERTLLWLKNQREELPTAEIED